MQLLKHVSWEDEPINALMWTFKSTLDILNKNIICKNCFRD